MEESTNSHHSEAEESDSSQEKKPAEVWTQKPIDSAKSLSDFLNLTVQTSFGYSPSEAKKFLADSVTTFVYGVTEGDYEPLKKWLQVISDHQNVAVLIIRKAYASRGHTDVNTSLA